MTDSEQLSFDHNEDRYPPAANVFAAVQESEFFPEGPVERLEVYATAGGEASCRVFTPRAEEPVIIVLSAADLS